MTIFQICPDADALLSLEPEELAGVLMVYINARPPSYPPGFNRHNLLHDPRNLCVGFPELQQEPLALALAEAFAWLEREGLLVRRVSSGSSDWYVVSRRGSRMKQREHVDSYRRANLLPRELLHPAIARPVWAAFLRGAYETAVFEAFREVEVAVRREGGFADTDYGVALMRRAFDPDKGPLRDEERLDAERKAEAELFAGAIGLFKNPHSHRRVNLDNPPRVVEILLLASHLLHRVDDRS